MRKQYAFNRRLEKIAKIAKNMDMPINVWKDIMSDERLKAMIFRKGRMK